MEKVVLGVKGMSCQHCVKAIEKHVGKIAEVQKVNVHLAEGRVEVEFRTEAGKLEEIKDCITDIGYEVSHS
jgi:copper chaperone